MRRPTCLSSVPQAAPHPVRTQYQHGVCKLKQDFCLLAGQAKTNLLVQKWLMIKTALFTCGENTHWSLLWCCVLPPRWSVSINPSALSSWGCGKQLLRHCSKSLWAAAAALGWLVNCFLLLPLSCFRPGPKA